MKEFTVLTKANKKELKLAFNFVEVICISMEHRNGFLIMRKWGIGVEKFHKVAVDKKVSVRQLMIFRWICIESENVISKQHAADSFFSL